ncbi:hypothetical protein EJO65_14370 [Escherichia coli]|uniref:Uncharacterized protein n=1 Tax=Escherichia coli TaxID=562 RepID=A0A826XNH7_ECOLX|nr:hypothetical protein [Escherichia coli]EEW5973937.1 hypothetical protein [Escherichia coli]EEY3544107.1 hypothetical protein [Escherichia coli]EEY3547439.1 hypothetical protein [Escherichia coli]EEY3551944.1 hypothetical protein [Escherichia coli]
MGLAKSINQYRLTPGFGGFIPVPYATTECRLPCRWRDIFSVYYYAILFIRLTVLKIALKKPVTLAAAPATER